MKRIIIIVVVLALALFAAFKTGVLQKITQAIKGKAQTQEDKVKTEVSDTIARAKQVLSATATPTPTKKPQAAAMDRKVADVKPYVKPAKPILSPAPQIAPSPLNKLITAQGLTMKFMGQ